MGSRLEKTSNSVRKRIEQHTFEDEDGDEYGSSKFGGFSEYFRRKKIKLQNRDAARRVASDKPHIFNNIVVHVNGYTQPSLNDIHNLVIDYGGGFLQYLDGKTMVTHIVASTLTPKKKVEFRKYRIVKPAWIVDSVEAGKLLPWESYRVVDEGVRQNLLGFQEGQMVSQTNKTQTGYREQTDTSWYSGQMKNFADGIETTSGLPPDNQNPAPGVSVDTTFKDSAVNAEIGEFSGTGKEDDQNQVSFNYGSFNSGDLPSAIEEEITKVYPDPQASGQDIEQQPSDAQDRDEQIAAVLPPNLVLKDDLQNFTGRKLTAEEHNAILLSDPRIWKSSTVNPGFLKQYYEESRLHHLSAWKAELKSKLQAYARELSASQQARRKRSPGSRRYIFHVDFDSFFVAVSLLKHPELVDKPVVVAHGDGSGSEIASCNYPARAFGVKNGTWMKGALELCPDLKVLPYDFKAYEKASKDFYAAIMETGGVVQSVSVDEALIDLSNACTQMHAEGGSDLAEGSLDREEARAKEIANDLRTKIKLRTGCEVSIGIGGNILQAKVALRKAKPAGQYLVTADALLDTIGSLNVQELPGVAYSMGAKLEDIGIKLVKDIREVSKERLINALGPKTGEKLWEYARGIDKAEVGDQVVRKSVSAEVNWGVRFVTQEQADEFVCCLSEELEKRLCNEDVKGRQLTMKIMRKSTDSPLDPPKFLGHGKCEVFNKSVVLGVPTTDGKILAKEALSILRGYGISPGELRGIGLQMTKLEPIKLVATDTVKGQRPLQFKAAPKPEPTTDEDPDEVDTPKKPARFFKHPAASLAVPTDDDPKSNSLLNTLGTQFVLPSQTDPAILAELPEEIRSKFASKSGLPKESTNQPKLKFQNRSSSPAPLPVGNFVPSASQIDPEVLAALPEDLRAEVLGFHHKSPQKPVKQAILPQSPHRDRTIKLPNKSILTKTKTSSLARVRGRLKDSKTSMMQANFAKLNDTRQVKDSESAAETSHDEGISAEFLAALPEDIRQEILEQQQRDRLKRKGGLEMGGANKKRSKAQVTQQQKVIELAPRPPKPEFTSMKLSTLPQLREAITDWYHAFEDEEPNDKDVETLCTYLRRVVLEEQDMSKAVSVVRWVLWTVDQDDRPFKVWQKAVEMLKNAVQTSVKERGVGPISFD